MRLSGVGVWSAQLRYGDPGESAEAAAELEEAGHVCIQVLTSDQTEFPREQWRRIAAAMSSTTGMSDG